MRQELSLIMTLNANADLTIGGLELKWTSMNGPDVLPSLSKIFSSKIGKVYRLYENKEVTRDYSSAVPDRARLADLLIDENVVYLYKTIKTYAELGNK